MIILLILTLISILISLYTTFLYAPTEIVMGDIQRIFYFHMGTVWVATVAFTIVFIASILFLKNGKRKWDILALSSAEIGVLFITLTIITGSIWAKPVWGTWWTWDPQLTTTFILWTHKEKLCREILKLILVLILKELSLMNFSFPQ